MTDRARLFTGAGTISPGRGGASVGSLVCAVAACGALSCPAWRARAYRTLEEVEGTERPIVWQGAARVTLESEGVTEGLASMLSDELRAAVAVWAAVSCSRWSPSYAGPDAEGSIAVRWVEDWATMGFDADAAATTEVSLQSAEGGAVEIVAATIYMNGTYSWAAHPATEPGRDARAVLVHELGHVAGLLHPCEEESGDHPCLEGDREASLYPIYLGPSQAALSADDVEGVCALYPLRAEAVGDTAREFDGCRADQDCGAGLWCIEARCRRELRYGDACSAGDQCLGRRCVRAPEGTGVCTFICESDGECPGGTRCARVETAAGLPSDPAESVCAEVTSPPAGCSTSPTGRDAAWPGLGLLLTLLLFGRRRHRWLAPLLLAAAVAGCGSPDTPDGGASSDAEVGADTGSPELDASAEVDAAAEVDGGPVLGPDSSVDGGDVTSDAGPPPPPCEPGQTRIADCGFCGSQGQECDAAGAWQPTSSCLGEGECAVASAETEALGMCQERQRLCMAGCVWGDWEETSPPGECEVGEIRYDDTGCASGLVREETCSASCGWAETRGCHDPCGGSPRTTPEWSREVCVPAGPFIRGSTLYTDTQPVAEVFVSSFYIDAYPVTNGRYRECVVAGSCTEPWRLQGRDSYRDPSRHEYPVEGVNLAQAHDFCMWDDRRRVPTEAEWEKAARGPAPRMNEYTYGDTLDCDLVYSGECGFRWSINSELPDRYFEVPGSRSFYGTFMQFGGAYEWVSDYYSASYYAEPSSRSDPQGPASGVFVRRGALRTWATRRISFRYSELDDGLEVASIRCSRSAS